MYNREKIINTMREIYVESKSIAPYVLIAQPRRDATEMPAQNFDGYDNLHVDLLGFSHGFVDIAGEKVDVARNYLLERALESGAKYLFFIGEDTVVPYDAFKRLHEVAEKNPGAVITGVYYIKLSGAMIMVREGNWITIPNVDPGQLLEAWQTGMDCMLIPIDLLRKMKEEDSELPFCCIGMNVEDDIPFVGEDNFFVHRLHKMGAKLLVDTNVQCLHMDLASGKYTAHPSVDLRNYYTNIKPTVPLTLEDKEYIDNRWKDRLPEGSGGWKALLNKWADEGKPIKFNMGCGRDIIDGYIGVDKYNDAAHIKQDLMTLVLPENFVDEILASHVIEHIPQHKAPGVLSKWFNSLKVGGKLVLELPDLEALCKSFDSASDQEKYILTLCIYGAYVGEVYSNTIEHGTASPHVWGYYPKILKEILTQIGFSEVNVMDAQGLHPGKNFRVEAIK